MFYSGTLYKAVKNTQLVKLTFVGCHVGFSNSGVTHLTEEPQLVGVAWLGHAAAGNHLVLLLSNTRKYLVKDYKHKEIFLIM